MSVKSPIAITALASVSALGKNENEVWNRYTNDESYLKPHAIGNRQQYAGFLDREAQKEVEALRLSDHKYKSLDKSVLFAMLASRKALLQTGWDKEAIFGINIGSSRGATELFEKYYKEFLDTDTSHTLTSPTTTLGNISSWVAHDLQCTGPEVSHSITCSTALHSLLNGIAWLRAGMCDKFLVGGSEAPLTDFTLAQMHALKIYTQYTENSPAEPWPNRALELSKTRNTLVLGEGAAVCGLEIGEKENALAYIEGIGYATEILEHNISISAEATCFQKSMKMALENTNISEVDAIVMHAPGTKAGDLTEYKAIQKVFGARLPMLTSNKWKIGHTFGASGLLSLELAVLMLKNQQFIAVPFAEKQPERDSIRKVLVNAVGFGGNAVSILLTRA